MGGSGFRSSLGPGFGTNLLDEIVALGAPSPESTP